MIPLEGIHRIPLHVPLTLQMTCFKIPLFGILKKSIFRVIGKSPKNCASEYFIWKFSPLLKVFDYAVQFLAMPRALG